MLTCKEVLDFLMAYIDNELGHDEREDFEAHLKVCPSCVNYLNSYRQTVRLSRESAGGRGCEVAGDENVPKELLDAVRHAIKHAAAAEEKK